MSRARCGKSCRSCSAISARAWPATTAIIPSVFDRFLRFGTWIGGDRDGNPFVTAEVTRQTIELLRGDALRRHLEACRDLENRLSLSDRYHKTETPVAAAVRKSRQQSPEIDKAVARCHPRDPIASGW